MTLGFLQSAVLLGLVGLAIPVLIHLWNRHRLDVVDWGAMQFLDLQPAQRRRFILEELLLLLLRMAMVGLLILGLAAPWMRGAWVTAWARPARDVVIVLDASASMARTDGEKTPWVHARAILTEELTALHPRDRWAVVLANRPVRTTADGFHSSNSAKSTQILEELAEPAGGADGPAAVTLARKMLDDHGQNPVREIVIVFDGQRQGWADPSAITHWEALSASWFREERLPTVTIRVRTTPDELPAAPANDSLTPLSASRRVIGVKQRVRFTSMAQAHSRDKALPPSRVRALVDDVVVKVWPGGKIWDAALGQGPIAFEHAFSKPGPHRVRVELEPTVHSGRTLDAFPADNHQDMIVDVATEFPVLVIDGTKDLTPDSSAFFVMNALADPNDPARASLVVPRRVPWSSFHAKDLAFKNGLAPRVVILADVPELSVEQSESLHKFTTDGGGLLVLLGPKANKDVYNRDFYREGKGWLPCRLDAIATIADGPITLDEARLQHPALGVFHQDGKNRLTAHRFPRWWKTTTPRQGSASLPALFANGDPWLIERTSGRGRTLVSTVPFDRSWDNPLVGTWEFPVLVHELIYGLAGHGSREFNLAPGEALSLGATSLSPAFKETSLPISLVVKDLPGNTCAHRVISASGSVGVPGPAGVYLVQIGDRAAFPVVVRDDSPEADLTPLTPADRQRLSQLLPLAWKGEPASVGSAAEIDIWRWFFVALLVFLCLETWLTRRMVAG